jgi:sugar phosphate isomerase/epimerase
MNMNLSLSIWNFSHNTNILSLEDIAEFARAQSYGLEIWPEYGEWADLFDAQTIKKVKPVFEGVALSLHTRTAQNTLDRQKAQIDAAFQYGADILVLHPDDLYFSGTREANLDLANQALSYAEGAGVRLALENGQFDFLSDIHQQIETIEFCLDIGHVYLVPETMKQFLDLLKNRINHLHFHDSLYPYEAIKIQPDWMFIDHHIPGTGVISEEDWRLVFTTMAEVNYQGSAVLEVRPYHPFQAVSLGMDKIKSLMESSLKSNQTKGD